jgi:hypothetical protein
MKIVTAYVHTGSPACRYAGLRIADRVEWMLILGDANGIGLGIRRGGLWRTRYVFLHFRRVSWPVFFTTVGW